MIRVTALYRWANNAHFDHRYYATEHMQAAHIALLPFEPVRVESERVVHAGPAVVGQVVAATQVTFASMASAQAALAQVGATLRADLPNYTNIQPEVYVGVIRTQDR